MDGIGSHTSPARRHRFGAVLLVVVLAGVGAGAMAAGASTTPTLTLKLASVDDVKITWKFDPLATRTGSALEVQRSANNAAFTLVKRIDRPRPSSSFTDKNVANGARSYRARLVINGVASPWGAVASIQVGSVPPPTTATTTTTTTAPTPPGGGAVEWSRAFGASTLDIHDTNVAVAPDGDVVIAGRFTGIVDFDRLNNTPGDTLDPINGHMFVVRYSADGQTLRWARQFGDVNGPDWDYLYTVAVGGTGDVYIGGMFQEEANFGAIRLTSQLQYPGVYGIDAFVAKLSPSGAVQWARSFGSPAQDILVALDVDASRIAVTGTWNATGQGSYAMIGILSTANGADVLAPHASTGGTRAVGVDVAIDEQGRTVVAGSFQSSMTLAGTSLSTSGGDDLFVARYSPTGSALGVTRYGGTKDDAVRGVATASDGDVVLTGSFGGTITFGGQTLTALGNNDMYVTHLAHTGSGLTHEWSRRYAATNPIAGFVAVADVDVDAAGNVIVAGSMISTVDFGTGPLSGPAQDVFLVKLAPGGTTMWAKRLNGTSIWNNNGVGGVAAAPGGGIVVAGRYYADIVIGSRTHTNANGQYVASPDGFVARFGP